MQLELTETARKDLKKLNKVTQKQIVKKLKFFIEQPEPLRFAVRLTAFSGAGDYRFRAGQYRILFDIVDGVIYIVHIEHRREVYRRK